MEEYRDIADFPHYQVSNLGNVRSNKRQGQILKPSADVKGYYALVLYNNAKFCKRIHRLVAETFIPKVEGKNEVDHIDRNKQNNCVENLRWVDRSQQMINTSRTGNNNVLKELYIREHCGFECRIRRNGIDYRKKFHTLDEAKAWRDEQLLLL